MVSIMSMGFTMGKETTMGRECTMASKLVPWEYRKMTDKQEEEEEEEGENVELNCRR